MLKMAPKTINSHCYFCGIKFKARDLLTAVRNHLALHTREKSYKCLQCGKSHKTFSSLRRHELKTHGGRGFICACKTLFRSKSEFIEHNNKFHKRITKRDIKCPKCRYKFHNNKEMLRHLNAHGRKKKPSFSVTCPECSKILKVGSLQSHIRQVHNKERNYQCGFCPMKCFTSNALTSHTRTHTGEKDLRKCNEPGCNEVCTSADKLIAHRKRVHQVGNPERKFACPHCSKEFNKKILKCHVESVHKKLKKHHCKLCQKAFYTKTGLNNHITTHTKEKPYECKWPGCHSQYSASQHLRDHVRRHEDKESARMFACKESNCAKVFETRFQLAGHVKRCHKFTFHKCYFCGSGIKNRALLKTHMITEHLKERGDKCGQCHKRFYATVKLNVHIDLTHGGRIKPCYFCGKKLASYNVIRHFRTHTEEKPWQCGFCRMDFCVVQAAQQHIKKSHLRNSSSKEIKQHVLEINGMN